MIANASDVLYYEVVTPRWEPHLTRISRLDPDTRFFDLIGELHNELDPHAGPDREGLQAYSKVPRTMRLYGGPPRPTEEFLRIEEGAAGASAGEL